MEKVVHIFKIFKIIFYFKKLKPSKVLFGLVKVERIRISFEFV
jgi:hypothetical protein